MINYLAREKVLQGNEGRPQVQPGWKIDFLCISNPILFFFYQVILVHRAHRDHRETKVCTLDITEMLVIQQWC